ncbi:hypothetical protein GUJ93_ZPchr0062g7135 [Zizania palustris]|uniref:Uncharacterized protein n=1 Tax=Zizania palustris TaxID=103762 RepID=A0A8J5QW44_ZIZPA|nr:hypothetical protein GUJ93_ZPchr0062g7135 [Zizania palustris]
MNVMECVIKKNESLNGPYKNPSFMCADVRILDLKIENASLMLLATPTMIYCHSVGLQLNPELYECGRIYRSLLGTWDGSGGEKRNSPHSTMLQCAGAYVKNKTRQKQICWLWQIVGSTKDREFQRLLDNVQYTAIGIFCYECIFVEGFVSTDKIVIMKNLRSIWIFNLGKCLKMPPGKNCPRCLLGFKEH